MLKYFILGSFLGISIPQYASNEDYHQLYYGMYKPHRDFITMKKYKFKNDIALSEKDYTAYFKSIFYSIYSMFHYFFIDKPNQFIETKQKRCFRLIEKFEFVKETIENMDYVTKNLRNEFIKSQKLKEGSYEQMALLEKQFKEENKTAEDLSLEYLKQIEEMSSDDYEKYLMSKSVMPKEEFLKTLSPEFLQQKRMDKLNLLESYDNALRENRNGESYDSMRNEFMKIHDKTNYVATQRSQEMMKNKSIEREKEKLDKLERQQGKDKSHKVKNVEKEIEELKKVFGNK